MAILVPPGSSRLVFGTASTIGVVTGATTTPSVSLFSTIFAVPQDARYMSFNTLTTLAGVTNHFIALQGSNTLDPNSFADINYLGTLVVGGGTTLAAGVTPLIVSCPAVTNYVRARVISNPSIVVAGWICVK